MRVNSTVIKLMDATELGGVAKLSEVRRVM